MSEKNFYCRKPDYDRCEAQCNKCIARFIVREEPPLFPPIPSKEGASQSSIPEEVSPLDLILEVRRLKEELRIARKNVDGLTHWWTEAKAERDEYAQFFRLAERDRDIFKKESEAYLMAWKEAATLLEGKNLEIAQLRVIQKEIEERHAYLRAEENKAINELDGLATGSIERTAKWAFIREFCARRNELWNWMNKYKKEEPKP